jgi:hypothetical protein
MPLLTEADSPRKRRTPVWVLILAAVVLLAAAVFGWSWFQPVKLYFGEWGWVAFGYNRGNYWPPRRLIIGGTPPVLIHYKLPGGRRDLAYVVGWDWWNR